MGPGINGMAGSPGPGNPYGLQVKTMFIYISSLLLNQAVLWALIQMGFPFQMGAYGSGQGAPPPYPGQGQLGQPAHQPPGAPMFVAPPPRPQRLLHSEAYLKYIEGLSADYPTISKWDQSLKGETGGKDLYTQNGYSVF